MGTTGDSYKSAGKIIFIIGVIGAIIFKISNGELGELTWVFIIATPVLVILGAFMLFRGRQIKNRESGRSVFDEASAKVLYLRAFKSDTSIGRFVKSAMIGDGMLILTGLSTIEEQLREAVKPFGNLIAVGKPGESFPVPGAARQYISEDSWKEKVIEHMRAAKLVIINAGNGTGLNWEIQRAIELVERQRFIVLLDIKRSQYENFKREFEHLTKLTLPESSTLKGLLKVGGFIIFKADQAIYLPLKAPFFYVSGYKPHIKLFQFSLKPVFEANDIVWKKPGISIAKIISFIILVLIFGFIIIGLIAMLIGR